MRPPTATAIMNELLSDQVQIEIIREFLIDIQEILDDLEPSILSLEKIREEKKELSEESLYVLHGVFRLFHSIKGSADYLHFDNLVNVAHAAENLLDNIRKSAIRLNSEHIDLLCKAHDIIKNSLSHIEEHLNDDGVAGITQELLIQFDPEKYSSTLSADASGAVTAFTKETEGKDIGTAPAIDLDLSPEEIISPEMAQHFQQEADDLLQEIEEDLLTWSKKPEDTKPVERLFRNIHSFKGNCGFLGYGDLEKLSHRAETILDTIKSGEEIQNDKIPDMLLQLLDVYKETLAKISEGGNGAIEGVDTYLDLLDDLLLPKGKAAEAEHQPPRLGEILQKQGVVTSDDVETALETQAKPIGTLLVESGAASEKDVARALGLQQKIQAKEPKPSMAAATSAIHASKRQDIRVDLDKLDSLINLTGELVIAENMIINNPDLKGLELENFNKAGQHMVKIVRELQEMAMNIRMVPVAGLFRRMIRLVHDLSRKSGKKVDLQLVGETTEIDKTVIEKITDPLVHLLRNSMDHGLEGPDERVAAGKPGTGTVKLSASHEEGNVIISIFDDGRGLDRDKILNKAIQKGLLDNDGSQMSNKDVFNLIFLPGFSTADKITDVSGRGVGMDVVRQNLESIKGNIEIRSKAGQGTTMILRIPLTLAIIEGMLIRTGNSLYILPILSIKESFQPTPDMITVTPDGHEHVRVRENLLPVLRLHKLHNITPDNHDLAKGILIVLETDNTNICLFVDELMGQQQTVIKGLSNYINKASDVGGVSGCTILGNGEVCLILDARLIEETFEEV